MENIESGISVGAEEGGSRAGEGAKGDARVESETRDGRTARDEADALDAAAQRETTRASAVSRIAYLLTGAAVIAVVFWWLQFSTGSICCGDFDGYYHVRWSQLLWDGLRHGKFPPVFTALPLTTLNPKDYVDHHFLFHLLQMPYSWFGDTVLAAKIGTALFASLAVFSCYWLVLRYRLRYPLMWLFALLACSAPFLFRMNMAKAMSVSIVLMVAGIWLLFERRYRWLLPLAFLFALTYDMFALLCLAALIWSGIVFWSEGRIEWRPVVFTIAGSIAGFIINPYFPHNIQLFAEHLLMKMKPGDFTARVGGEWYPYDSWEFTKNCGVAFIAMVAGYIAFRWEDRKLAARPLFFLVFSTILLIANARWKRFAEYWPPFAVLFAAFSLHPILDGVRRYLAHLPADVLNDLKPFLDRETTPADRKRQQRMLALRYGAAAIVTIALSLQMVANIRAASKEISESAPPDHYRKGMEWIRANVPEGEMIFNTDWDDFPRLFYFSPRHSYVSGLDPTYLLDQNPDLFHLYENVTLGKEKDPARIIRERFHARYVFTDKEEVHDEFYNKAMDSGWFEEVYDDDHCTVLRLLDQWREPPPAPDENDAAVPAAPADEGGDEGEPEPANEQ